jgi:hypothetical protein
MTRNKNTSSETSDCAWHKFEDAIPDECKKILVRTNTGEYFIAMLTMDRELMIQYGSPCEENNICAFDIPLGLFVTHWCYLPSEEK